METLYIKHYITLHYIRFHFWTANIKSSNILKLKNSTLYWRVQIHNGKDYFYRLPRTENIALYAQKNDTTLSVLSVFSDKPTGHWHKVWKGGSGAPGDTKDLTCGVRKKKAKYYFDKAFFFIHLLTFHKILTRLNNQ
jgi:hypothetical protein